MAAPSGPIPRGSASPPSQHDHGDPTQIMFGGPSSGSSSAARQRPTTGVSGGAGGDHLPPVDDGWEYEPEYEPPPGPWWSRPAAIVAVGAGAVVLILGIIAVFVVAGGDGGRAEDGVPSPSTVESQNTVSRQTTTTTIAVTSTTQSPLVAPTITLPIQVTFPVSVTTSVATNPSVAATSAAPLTTQPPPTTDAPAVPTTGDPVPTTEEPVPTTEEPVPTTDEPVPTTEEPVPTTEEPVPTTEEPVPTTEEPVPTTEEPVPTTEEPVPTTEEPVPPTLPAQSNFEVVQADPNLTLFEQAVITAGLEGSLSGTILAPTDAAMNVIPNLASVLADPAASVELVLSHRVGEPLDSAAIFASVTLDTVGGDTLTIDGAGQTMSGPGGDAAIVSADHNSVDGFVHLINAVLVAPVLVPPTTDALIGTIEAAPATTS